MPTPMTLQAIVLKSADYYSDGSSTNRKSPHLRRRILIQYPCGHSRKVVPGHDLSEKCPFCKKRYGSVEIGNEYGHLRVIGFSSIDLKPLVVCLCSCGNTASFSAVQLSKGTGSCGCLKAQRAKMVGEISGTFYSHLKASARTRGIPFNVTMDDLWGMLIAQGNRCKLSGLQLFVEVSAANASVDRIDGHRGYEPNNIQWVHKDINMMKGRLSAERFELLCGLVGKHHEGAVPSDAILTSSWLPERRASQRKRSDIPKSPNHKISEVEILNLMDKFREVHGEYPTCLDKRPVPGRPSEKWANLDMALRVGMRGLGGKTSIARLLQEHRGVERRWRKAAPR